MAAQRYCRECLEQITPAEDGRLPDVCPSCGAPLSVLSLEDIVGAEARAGEPATEESQESPPGGPEGSTRPADMATGSALPAESERAGRAAATGARLLCFWTALTGVFGLVCAAASLVSFLSGGEATAVLGGSLLVLVCALPLLALSALYGLRFGAAVVSSRAAGAFGLLVCAAALVESVARGCAGLFASGVSSGPSSQLMFSGYAALIGCAVFLRFLGGRAWASRSAAISLFVFVLSLFVPWEAGYNLPGIVARLPLSLSPLEGSLLAFAAVCAAGCGLVAVRLRRGAALSRNELFFISLSFILASVAIGVGARLMSSELGTHAAGVRLLVVGALCEAAGFLPVLLTGTGAAWRSRGEFKDDLRDLGRFGWLMVALGAAAFSLVWLPRMVGRGPFDIWVTALGALAVIIAAWLGTRREPWIARWAVAPVVGAAVIVLAGPGVLLSHFDAAGLIAARAMGGWTGVFVWLAFVVPAVLGAGGVCLASRELRAEGGRSCLQTDANIVLTAGWATAWLMLALCVVARTAAPDLASAMLSSVARLGRLGGDVFYVAAGPYVASWVSAAGRSVIDLMFLGGAGGFALLVAALTCVLVLHVGATWGNRWCGNGVGILWSMAVGLFVVLTLACAAGLFRTMKPEVFDTGIGRLCARHVAARYALLVLLFALTFRFWDGARALVRLARPVAGGEPGPGEEARRGEDSRFSHLMNFGLLLSVVGAVLALLLGAGMWTESVLYQLGKVGNAWARSAALLASSAGVLAAHWWPVGCAVACIPMLLMAMHEETRRGRTGAYPWVAAFWTLLLLWATGRAVRHVLALGWPSEAGQFPVIAALTFLWLAMALTTVALWRDWRQLTRPEEGTRRSSASGRRGPRAGAAARGLGRVGFFLGCTFAVMVLYNVVWSLPGGAPRLEVMKRGLMRLIDSVAFSVDYLEARLDGRNMRGALALALGVVSAALMVMHYLAQHRFRSVRLAVTAVWTVLVLCGVAAFGQLVDVRSAGSWDAGQVLGALALGSAIGGGLTAVARSWVALLGVEGRASAP